MKNQNKDNEIEDEIEDEIENEIEYDEMDEDELIDDEELDDDYDNKAVDIYEDLSDEEDSITLVEEVEKMTKELHKLPYYKNKDNKLAKDMIKTILSYLDLEICDMVKVGESYDFDLCPKGY